MVKKDVILAAEQMKKVVTIPVLCYLIGVVFFFTSCSEYNKILKGNDYAKKYETAIAYLDKGDCYRALPLFEELMTYYSRTEKAEDIYYYYAKTHYCLQDYYMAGYYFKKFTKNFPYSPKKEECAFMAAVSYIQNSPEYNLDPSSTYDAIDELQLFMDRYPESKKVDTCNQLIKDLRGKLERKSYEQGKLYYKMQRYNSAVISFGSTLQKFPDTKYREELMFLIVKANYLFANNSIQSKKSERFQQTIKSYRTFADRFPESSYLKGAETYYLSSVKALEKVK